MIEANRTGAHPGRGEEVEIPVSYYLRILFHHRYKLIGFVAACVLCTAVINAVITPVYEATATVEVDPNIPPGELGQDVPVLDEAGFKRFQREARTPKLSDDNLKIAHSTTPESLRISYRSPNPDIAAETSNTNARSFLDYLDRVRLRALSYRTRFIKRQIADLESEITSSQVTLVKLGSRQADQQTEAFRIERLQCELSREATITGALEAAVTSTNDQLAKLIQLLDKAGWQSVDTRTEYKDAPAEFEHSRSELEKIKEQVEAESILNHSRLERLDALQRGSAIRSIFTDEKTGNSGNARSDREWILLLLKIQADASLLNNLKIRESEITSNLQKDAVRLGDRALPPVKPVFPNKRLNLVFALLFSTFLAVGGTIGWELMRNPGSILSEPKDLRVGTPRMGRTRESSDFVVSSPGSQA